MLLLFEEGTETWNEGRIIRLATGMTIVDTTGAAKRRIILDAEI